MRIMLADDHTIVREGLSLILDMQPDMQVVGQADNGYDAVNIFFQHMPDLLLLDLSMPGLNGVDVVIAIRSRVPDARILILTVCAGDEDIYRSLKAGAKGYLLKDVPREELVTAIRTVHHGGQVIPPAIATKVTERVMYPELTARELEVLQFLAMAKSNKEIGHALFITEGTAKTHVNSILTKLGVMSRTEAVIAALKRGLIRLT